jgi:hypothetical protein
MVMMLVKVERILTVTTDIGNTMHKASPYKRCALNLSFVQLVLRYRLNLFFLQWYNIVTDQKGEKKCKQQKA